MRARSISLRWFVLCAFWLMCAPAALAVETPLVAADAIWRYLDNGTNQGAARYAPNFNDAAWASGPAQLGYSYGGETTAVS